MLVVAKRPFLAVRTLHGETHEALASNPDRSNSDGPRLASLAWPRWQWCHYRKEPPGEVERHREHSLESAVAGCWRGDSGNHRRARLRDRLGWTAERSP